jgi:hypothetical protein
MRRDSKVIANRRIKRKQAGGYAEAEAVAVGVAS